MRGPAPEPGNLKPAGRGGGDEQPYTVLPTQNTNLYSYIQTY